MLLKYSAVQPPVAGARERKGRGPSANAAAASSAQRARRPGKLQRHVPLFVSGSTRTPCPPRTNWRDRGGCPCLSAHRAASHLRRTIQPPVPIPTIAAAIPATISAHVNADVPPSSPIVKLNSCASVSRPS